MMKTSIFSSPTRVSVYAQGLLAQLENLSIDRIPQMPEEVQGYRMSNENNHASVIWQLSVYPNPSEGKTTIKLNHTGIGTLLIVDALGKIHLETRLDDSSQEQIISGLQPGIYVVKYQDDAGETVTKQLFVK